MLDIPAICNGCGVVFVMKNALKGKGKIIFKNSTIGPCPTCGSKGNIFDGAYDLASESIKLVLSVNPNQLQLSKLKNILLIAQKDNFTHKQISDQISKEVPELQSLKDVLPKTRSELYAFITLLLAVIFTSTGAIYALFKNNNEDQTPLSKTEIKKHAESTVKEAIKKGIHVNVNNTQITIINNSPIVGRNDPCPCNNGKKYKKCCGKKWPTPKPTPSLQ